MKLEYSEYKRITKLCEFGDQFIDKGEFLEALKQYNKALEIVPRPANEWEASTWIYSAIGDAYFFLGDFDKAKDAFYNAANCPDGICNPYILLRLGQSLYEDNDLEKAKEYLLRAYMLEEVEIFDDEDNKYYDLIKDLISTGRNSPERGVISYHSDRRKQAEGEVVNLDSDMSGQIKDYMSECEDEYEKGNYLRCIELLEKAWEILPEPKGFYSESFHIADYISEVCLLCRDISKAKKWSEALFSCDLERSDGGERDFLAGKVALAANELDRARKFFAVANEKSRGRCFEGEDSKYLRFFRDGKV